MEWFKSIDNFNEDEEDVWNYNGSVLIDLDTWRKKEVLESHLESTYANLSVGERKSLKKILKDLWTN